MWASLGLRCLRRWSVLAGAICGLVASPAMACELALGSVSSRAFNYDPFAFSDEAGELRVEVSLRAGSECAADLALVDAAGSRASAFRLAPGVALEARLVPGDGVTPGLDAATAKVRLNDDAPRAVVAWAFTMNGGAVLRPGDYSVEVGARLDGPMTSVAHGELRVVATPRAQISLGGSSGGGGESSLYTLDLGQLRTGQQRSAYLHLRANTDAVLEFRSANGGNLVREGDPDSGAVAYRFDLAGRTLDLSGPAQRLVPAPPTLEAAAMEMRVTIGEVEGQLAGRYGDTITIDVWPR